MKAIKKFSVYALTLVFLFSATSCKKDKEEKIDLPPQNSMIMDFNFGQTTKSVPAAPETVVSYYAISALNVGFWSIVAAAHTIIPAAAFQKAFENQPFWDDDAQVWVWGYSVPVLTDTYDARLTGKIVNDSIKWEMYLSKSGANLLKNILWFEGKSHYGRTGGWWILNQPIESVSQVTVEPAIKVDWTRQSDDVFSLRYTYVADEAFSLESNSWVTNKGKGGYIEYGRKADPVFDAWYLLYNGESKEKYNIYWNTATKAGKVELEGGWQGCWDSNLLNTVCN